MANQQFDEVAATGASGFARLIAVAALGFFVACVPASASGYMTLGLPDKDKAVTAIGQAPKKETIELKLGDIRTREAQLPGGSTTLRERMAMRAKLREKRQLAVTMATRKPSVNFEGDNQATN